VIDLDRLDASLDLALADELRIQRATATADRDAEANHIASPPPEAVPAPVTSRRGRSTPGGTARRRPPSPTLGAPATSSPLAPAEVVWDEFDIDQHGRAIVGLVSQAKLAEADLHLVAHAELARDVRPLVHRADAAGWAVMRALLAGREDAARAGIDEAKAFDPEGLDPGIQDRHWLQRFAVALAWGDDNERYDVLERCRERAYCHGDAAWQGRLTLLLSVLGRDGEAGRELDFGISTLLNTSESDAGWLDLATDLAEAAAVLGDGHRADLVRQGLARAGTESFVVAGRAWVCKGSVARYQALAAATAGAVDGCDGYFRSAAEAHRRSGAEVLLARTLGEWGQHLARLDPQRGAELLRDSAELSRRLSLVPNRPTSVDVAARAS